jgi:hypothetical protein
MSDLYGVSRRRMIGEAWFWILMVLLVVAVVGIGLWAFGVFTSDVRGAGGAIKQRNSTVNRVQKQEMFEQLAADYDGYIIKIKAAVIAVSTTIDEDDKSLRQTELVGLRQVCVDAAQQFNAESKKYTSRVWKSAGLPLALDPEGCLST